MRKLMEEKLSRQNALPKSLKPTNLYEGHDYVVVKSVNVQKSFEIDSARVQVNSKSSVKRNLKYFQDV